MAAEDQPPINPPFEKDFPDKLTDENRRLYEQGEISFRQAEIKSGIDPDSTSISPDNSISQETEPENPNAEQDEDDSIGVMGMWDPKQ